MLGLQEILDDSYFPLLEEFAYRGALILFLGKKIKKNWLIAIFAALIFAIAHFDFSFSHLLNYFLWGYVLSYAYLYTKSLLPGILMHITANICIDLLWLF
jgi:membrane protease YdiL (CAAX protease family)